MPKILTNYQAKVVAEELCCTAEYINDIAEDLIDEGQDASAQSVMNYLMPFAATWGEE